MEDVGRWLGTGLLAMALAACGGDDFSGVMGGGGPGGGGTGGGGASTGGASTGGGGSGGSGGGVIGPNCGDGKVDYADGEQCDDGNNSSGDGCSANCQVEAASSCGDGTLDLQNDEQCDDGNNSPGDGCSPSCQFEPVGQTCGDSNIDSNEACDDGNTANGDGCNPTCNLTNTTTLFAGSPGQAGTADGVGTAARFGGYGNLTVNATHLFLGDGANRIIRKIEIATADVVTVAGDPNAGQQHVDDPQGLNARFGSVGALTTDGSTVWIADAYNRVIRAMSATPPHGVTTVVGAVGQQGHLDGNGNAARLDGIRGLTYHGGYVYLVDGTASTLRRFDPSTGDLITLAGAPYTPGQVDGLGSNARFISPRYMASDGSGMLYIADTNGNQIRAYNTVTTEVTTFAGSGACGYADGIGTAAVIHRPRGMTSDGTSIYWVEFNAHTIRQGLLVNAEVSTLVGSFPSCSATCSCGSPPPGSYAEGVGTAALFANPFSVAFHYPSRSLFVVDGGNNVIRRIQ